MKTQHNQNSIPNSNQPTNKNSEGQKLHYLHLQTDMNEFLDFGLFRYCCNKPAEQTTSKPHPHITTNIYFSLMHLWMGWNHLPSSCRSNAGVFQAFLTQESNVGVLFLWDKTEAQNCCQTFAKCHKPQFRTGTLSLLLCFISQSKSNG